MTDGLGSCVQSMAFSVRRRHTDGSWRPRALQQSEAAGPPGTQMRAPNGWDASPVSIASQCGTGTTLPERARPALRITMRHRFHNAVVTRSSRKRQSWLSREASRTRTTKLPNAELRGSRRRATPAVGCPLERRVGLTAREHLIEGPVHVHLLCL